MILVAKWPEPSVGMARLLMLKTHLEAALYNDAASRVSGPPRGIAARVGVDKG